MTLYEVIDVDKFVDADNHIKAYFVDIDNLSTSVKETISL